MIIMARVLIPLPPQVRVDGDGITRITGNAVRDERTHTTTIVYTTVRFVYDEQYEVFRKVKHSKQKVKRTFITLGDTIPTLV